MNWHDFGRRSRTSFFPTLFSRKFASSQKSGGAGRGNSDARRKMIVKAGGTAPGTIEEPSFSGNTVLTPHFTIFSEGGCQL